LSQPLRAFFEPRFGYDFGQVSVHVDERAAAIAQVVNAQAFTMGRDIVFGAGQYAPGTVEGKKLLAHEMAHVIQQSQSGNILIQGRWEYPPDISQLYDIGRTYTILHPTRLRPQGPFTLNLLHLISSTFTVSAAWHSQEMAHAILEALESSATFVFIAQQLDRYYRRRNTPDISIFWANGSRFIPAGAPPFWPGGSGGRGDRIHIDRSVTTFRPGAMSSAGLAYQTMAFVRVVVHEAAHAYRHIRSRVGAGLRGVLQDERQTRILESRMMAQVEQRAQGALLQEARQQRQLVGSTLIRETAQDIVSGSGVSYVENYHINQTFRAVYPNYEQAKRTDGARQIRGFSNLRSIEELGSRDYNTYRDAVRQMITNNSRRPPPTSRTTSDGPTSTPVEPQPSPPPTISSTASTTLLQLLNSSPNLAQLASRRPQGLSDGETALFYYIVLLKIHHVKFRIAEEHRRNRRLTRGSPQHRQFLDRIARDYLGRPNAYADILD